MTTDLAFYLAGVACLLISMVVIAAEWWRSRREVAQAPLEPEAGNARQIRDLTAMGAALDRVWSS